MTKLEEHQKTLDSLSALLQARRDRLEPPQPPEISEYAHPPIFEKFLHVSQYNTKDIRRLCAELFKKNASRYGDFDLKKTFRVAGNEEEIKNHVAKCSRRDAFFVIHRRRATNIWALICVVNISLETAYVCYKSPTGDAVPQEIKTMIETDDSLKLKKVTFKSSSSNDLGTANDLSGPICVRNLKLLLDKLTNSLQEVDNFEKLPFYTSKNLKEEKSDLLAFCAFHLGRNDHFKGLIKKFLDDSMKDILKMCEKTTAYTRYTRANGFTSDETFQTARKNHLGTKRDLKDFTKKFQALTPKALRFGEKPSTKYYTMLRIVFSALDCAEQDEQYRQALDNIATIFEIPLELLEDSFTLGRQQQLSQDQALPQPFYYETEVKIVNKASPDLDIDAITGDSTLKSAFNKVKDKYQNEWASKKISEINEWALQKKDTYLSDNEDSVSEAVAAINRVMILKKGFALKNTEICCLLGVAFKKTPLCQVSLGTSKGTVLALLAALKALQGLKVDVIVNTERLAKDFRFDAIDLLGVLGITVATNNPKDAELFNSYLYDVVFGTISNFQFDYLKNLYSNSKERGARKFDCLIIDEIDNIILDRAADTAKIAESFPGSEALRYIFIKIWVEVVRAEEQIEAEYLEKVNAEYRKNMKKVQKAILKEDQAKTAMHKIYKESLPSSEHFKKIIVDSNPTSFNLLPEHLKKYADKRMTEWIDIAIYVRYHCFENVHYRILDVDGKKKIVPLDYQNTGENLVNAVWDRGYHQFLQVKHNLHLTFENLSWVMISNIGYVGLYDKSKIIGVSESVGTIAYPNLGDMQTIKIPSPKPKSFKEEPGFQVEDDVYSQILVAESVKQIKNNKSVFVLCPDVKTLKSLDNDLKNYQKLGLGVDFKVVTIDNGTNVVNIKTDTVVLSTVYRGIHLDGDFKALHLIIGFMPMNHRIEDKAVARVSKPGIDASLQIIVRKSDLEKADLSGWVSTEWAKSKRNQIEDKRLQQLKDVHVQTANFKDKIHREFVNFYCDKKKLLVPSFERYLILRDLKESWANWSEDNVRKYQSKFQYFVKMYDLEYIDFENISCRNPFYDVLRAESIMTEDPERARDLLLKTVSFNKINYVLLYTAHLKLFDAVIRCSRHQESALSNVVSIGRKFKAPRGPDYLPAAIEHLFKAHECIFYEISYIEDHLILKKGGEDEHIAKIIVSTNNNNLFLKHIYSRLTALKLFQRNIEQLLKDLDYALTHKNSNVLIQTKSQDYYKHFSRDSRFKNYLLEDEIEEFREVGMDTFYVAKYFHDLHLDNYGYALALVNCGLALASIGSVYVVFKEFITHAASILMCEGVTDMIFLYLGEGHMRPDMKRYAYSLCFKLINDSVKVARNLESNSSLLLKIVYQSIKATQTMSDSLPDSKRFKEARDEVGAWIHEATTKLSQTLEAKRVKSSKIMIETYAALEYGPNLGAKLTQRVVLRRLALEMRINLIKTVAKKLRNDKTLCRILHKADEKSIKKAIYSLFAQDKTLLEALSSIAPSIKSFSDLNVDLYNVAERAAGIIKETNIVNFGIISSISEGLKATLKDDNQANGPLKEFLRDVSKDIAENLVKTLLEGVTKSKPKEFKYAFFKDHTQNNVFTNTIAKIRGVFNEVAEYGLNTALRSLPSVAEKIVNANLQSGKINSDTRNSIESAFIASALQFLGEEGDSKDQLELLKRLKQEIQDKVVKHQ